MRLTISLPRQQADLHDERGVCIRRYPVSTATNGAGEEKDSFRTPRGRHVIRAKIGAGEPLGSVFAGRRPTGEICTADLRASSPGRDWILTRILWLSGTQIGINRRGRCDTMQRYIYIHGTPDGTPLGRPGSRGCIRMANADIVELFDLLPCYSVVDICED